MRRALTAAVVLSLAWTPAFAQESETDTQHNTEEPREAVPPAAVAPPPVTVSAAAVTAAKPRVGDVSLSGYFRGGFGASNQKGRMTCFALANPSGLVSKYRLGNECEVWSETHFTVVTYAGDDGVVANLHFMPTIYIPTTNIGYSPNGTVNSPSIFTTSTGATVSFPNLYVDIKGISVAGRRHALDRDAVLQARIGLHQRLLLLEPVGRGRRDRGREPRRRLAAQLRGVRRRRRAGAAIHGDVTAVAVAGRLRRPERSATARHPPV